MMYSPEGTTYSALSAKRRPFGQNQRCQIVADKLLTAMHNNDQKFALLMCGYILHSKPATRRIRINTDGEIQGNEFLEE